MENFKSIRFESYRKKSITCTFLLFLTSRLGRASKNKLALLSASPHLPFFSCLFCLQYESELSFRLKDNSDSYCKKKRKKKGDGALRKEFFAASLIKHVSLLSYILKFCEKGRERELECLNVNSF